MIAPLRFREAAVLGLRVVVELLRERGANVVHIFNV